MYRLVLIGKFELSKIIMTRDLYLFSCAYVTKKKNYKWKIVNFVLNLIIFLVIDTLAVVLKGHVKTNIHKTQQILNTINLEKEIVL